MTSVDVIASASSILETGGYHRVEAFPEWNTASNRLFEDEYNVLAGAEDASSTNAAALDQLPELLDRLTSAESRAAAIDAELRTAESAVRQQATRREAIARRLNELGIKNGDAAEREAALDWEIGERDKRRQSLRALYQTGEAFALGLSQTADVGAIKELEREIATMRARLQKDEADLKARSVTGDRAQQIIEALREASSQVVSRRIAEIEPLLTEIYSRIDIHPAFRAVRFLTSIVRGKGQLAAVVSDPLSEVESDAPSTVLSSSQMNALAVCTFLSMNMGVANPPLQSAILDDPLQSLDDINLLGLIDLLRRMKDQRQLLVSTHDARFGNLLAEKLRPASPEQRTVLIELEGWSRKGPEVITREIQSDPVALRLVAG